MRSLPLFHPRPLVARSRHTKSPTWEGGHASNLAAAGIAPAAKAVWAGLVHAKTICRCGNGGNSLRRLTIAASPPRHQHPDQEAGKGGLAGAEIALQRQKIAHAQPGASRSARCRSALSSNLPSSVVTRSMAPLSPADGFAQQGRAMRGRQGGGGVSGAEDFGARGRFGHGAGAVVRNLQGYVRSRLEADGGLTSARDPPRK